MSEQQGKRYQSFREFYPYYLSEHQHPVCRRLHVLGSTLIILIVLAVLFGASAWWLLATPVVGYGFAWIGHFFFEHNRPATFTYPLWSLMGDWVMFKDVITGRIPF